MEIYNGIGFELSQCWEKGVCKAYDNYSLSWWQWSSFTKILEMGYMRSLKRGAPLCYSEAAKCPSTCFTNQGDPWEWEANGFTQPAVLVRHSSKAQRVHMTSATIYRGWPLNRTHVKLDGRLAIWRIQRLTSWYLQDMANSIRRLWWIRHINRTTGTLIYYCCHHFHKLIPKPWLIVYQPQRIRTVESKRWKFSRQAKTEAPSHLELPNIQSIQSTFGNTVGISDRHKVLWQSNFIPSALGNIKLPK
jgi:hypothetical protein